MTEITTFGEAAPEMNANGYTPIPLAPATKQPMLAGWSSLNSDGWSVDRLRAEIQHNAAAACGWAVGRNSLAVDIDVTDKAAAKEATDIVVRTLGDTPIVRVGQAPKTMLIYRADDLVRSAKPFPVELFSGTGQVAVFGWHAKAGRPYLWPQANLLTTPVDSPDVPFVTTGQVTAVLSRLDPLLRPLRQGRSATRTHRSVASDLDPQKELAALLTRLPWPHAAKRLLQAADKGTRTLSLYAVIASARRHSIDEDHLIRVLERHGDHLIDAAGEDYVERTLDCFYGQPAAESPEWAQQILTSRRNLERNRASRRKQTKDNG